MASNRKRGSYQSDASPVSFHIDAHPPSASDISTDQIGIQNISSDRTIDAYLDEAYTSSSSSSWTARLPYLFVILSLGVANSSDAAEILCLSYILSDKKFDEDILHGDLAFHGGLLAGSVFAGMLLGGLVVGVWGDSVGRRPALLLGLLINSIAGALSAAAPNAIILSLIRLVAGVGIGATVPPLFSIVAELSPPSRRGLFVTIVASFWMVGSIYVALMGLFVFEIVADTGWGGGWRVFALWCALPSATGATLVYYLVPESPRFLACHDGKYEKACKVANTLAAQMGYRTDCGGGALTVEEVRNHYTTSGGDRFTRLENYTEDRSETGALPSIAPPPLSSTTSSGAWKTLQMASQSIAGLYARKLCWHTTIPLQAVWFSLSFGSYGLLIWINSLFVAVHLKNVYVNALLFAAANLPGNLLSGAFMDTIGRKVMLSCSMVFAALSLVFFAWFARDPDGKRENGEPVGALGIVLSACAFQAFSISGWNTIDCMTGELFPTHVRSTGMGICTASGRIGAMVAQFVNGSLAGRPAALLIVASSTLLFGALTPCMLGEDMSQRPLEDDVDSTHSQSGGSEQSDSEPLSSSYNSMSQPNIV